MRHCRSPRWRAELDAAYTGTPRTSQGVALQPFIREFNLPRARFEELIDGVEMDLSQVRYADVRGAARVLPARRVGRRTHLRGDLRLPRFCGSLAYAESLGIALQLTNIIRDVAVDLRRGRIYLPAEDLATVRRERGRPAAWARDPGGRSAAAVRVRARALLLSRAAWQLPATDAVNLVAAEIMGGIYYGILQPHRSRPLRRLLVAHSCAASASRGDCPPHLAADADRRTPPCPCAQAHRLKRQALSARLGH